MRACTIKHLNNRSALALIALFLAFPAAHAQSLSGQALVNALRAGGYVILMRHASSPAVRPDKATAESDNPDLERQLDDTGRTSAHAMGEAIRDLRIPVGQVLSSPTYRALQTIKLAQLGSPAIAEELGDGGQSMQADEGGGRASWLKAKIAVLPGPHENTLIVTHFPNIIEAFPDAAGLADGEALIFRPDGHGGAALVARVKIGDWSRLATIR
jgi:phosphohistidine phosphatase SixA